MNSEQAPFYCPEHDRTFKNKGAMLSHYKLAKHDSIPPEIAAELGLPAAGNAGASAEELEELRQALEAHEKRLDELSGASEAVVSRLDGQGEVLAGANEELNGLTNTIRSVLTALGVGKRP